MSRHFPLCIFSVILALFGSITAPRDPPKYPSGGPPTLVFDDDGQAEVHDPQEPRGAGDYDTGGSVAGRSRGGSKGEDFDSRADFDPIPDSQLAPLTSRIKRKVSFVLSKMVNLIGLLTTTYKYNFNVHLDGLRE